MVPQERNTIERLLRALEEKSETLQTLSEHPERLAEQLGLDERELAALRSSDLVVSKRQATAESTVDFHLSVFSSRTERAVAEFRRRVELGDVREGEGRPSAPSGLARREALKRALVLGGSVLWVTPVIEMIGTRYARAQGSPPPRITFTTGSTITGRPR
jgi:hypothetical protein